MKYKLIKKYPGSLELGDKVVYAPEFSFNPYRCKNQLFSKEYIENNPEFWEKVEEKEYEILTYTYNPNSSKKSNVCQYYSKQKLIKDEVIVINSVKRLSDNEVFSVGELVGLNSSFTKVVIERIKTFENTLYFAGNTFGQKLDKLVKIKEPKILFTTLDGVEIKEGDEYYCIDTVNFRVRRGIGAKEFTTEKWTKNSYASKENAEKWIAINKPQYSIKEMVSIINVWAMTEIVEDDILNYLAE